MKNTSLINRLLMITAWVPFFIISAGAQTALALYRGGESDSGASDGTALLVSLNDSSGNARNGTKQEVGGVYTTSTSAPGSTLAYDFAGQTYYSTEFLSGLTTATSSGMELWFRASTLTGGSQVLIHNGSTNFFGLGLYLNDATLSVLAGGSALHTITTLTDTDWHYVAFIYDATTGTMDAYYDDLKVVSDHALAFNNPTFGRLTLGSSSSGEENFFGAIDEARIFTFDDGTFTTAMLNNPTLSGVPEPSSYAVIFGLAALTVSCTRRRRW